MGVSLYTEAAAQAEDAVDLFRKLEACGQLRRIDPAVEPEMYRCATVSESELTSLRQIDNVVRHGRVVHIGPDRVVLEKGSIPAGDGHVYVDCSAVGLRMAPGRPVFAPGLITLQAILSCQPAFSAALAGYVEATRHDDAEKNRLCPPNPYMDEPAHLVPLTLIGMNADYQWNKQPDIAEWLQRARLNPIRGVMQRMHEPRVQQAMVRFTQNAQKAVANLRRMHGASVS